MAKRVAEVMLGRKIERNSPAQLGTDLAPRGYGAMGGGLQAAMDNAESFSAATASDAYKADTSGTIDGKSIISGAIKMLLV